MNDLASEFFYDGISRIPPGLLIIILYWRTEGENIFHNHRDFFSSPLLFTVCVLAFAWLIGIAVEAIIVVLTAYALRLLSLRFKFASSMFSLLLGESTPGERLKPDTNEKDFARERRRQVYFHSAIKIMSRCLFVVCLFVCIIPPETFSSFRWHWYYGMVGFVAFLLLWLWQKGFVNQKGCDFLKRS